MAGDEHGDEHGDGWDGDQPADGAPSSAGPGRSRRRQVVLAAGVAAAVVAVLVGTRTVSPPGPTPEVRPGAAPAAAFLTGDAGSGNPDPPPDPDVECMGSGSFRPAVLTGLYRDLAAGDAADRALLTAIRTGDGLGGLHPLPTTGWRRIVDLPDDAQWLHEQSPNRTDARVTFRRDRGDWRYATSAFGGPCVPARAEYAADDTRIRSADGMGMTLLVDVAGGTCLPHHLELAPTEVVETDRTVTLTVHALPSTTGTGACAGVDETVTEPVGLHAPLGSRTVLDGRYFPAQPVPVRR